MVSLRHPEPARITNATITGTSFGRSDGDYYVVIEENDFYRIGITSDDAEVANAFDKRVFVYYWYSDIKLPSLKLAEQVCHMLAEAYGEGCTDSYQ
jgi:hypothetical protein